MSFVRITSSQDSYNGGALFTLNKNNYNYGTPPVLASGLISTLNTWVGRYKAISASGV